MRHYVIASHGGFSKGIYESIKIIIGEQAGVDIITAFIDGKNDIEVLVNGTLEKIPSSDEIIVCTDVFGGSVKHGIYETAENTQKSISDYRNESSFIDAAVFISKKKIRSV